MTNNLGNIKKIAVDKIMTMIALTLQYELLTDKQVCIVTLG